MIGEHKVLESVQVEISRKAAARVALPDQARATCGAPVFMR